MVNWMLSGKSPIEMAERFAVSRAQAFLLLSRATRGHFNPTDAEYIEDYNEIVLRESRVRYGRRMSEAVI